MVDVTVYGGKYRYVFDKDGARAYRHGEEWRDCCGDGLVLALAQDLEEARDQRDQLREALSAIVECWDGPLYKHEMLPRIQQARAALKATEEDV